MRDLKTEELDRLAALADKATPGKRESIYTTYKCYIQLSTHEDERYLHGHSALFSTGAGDGVTTR